MRIWLAVTQDKYQLPVAVADTAAELARMMGVRQSTVISSISRQKQRAKNLKSNRGQKKRYFCITIDDDDEMENEA